MGIDNHKSNDEVIFTFLTTNNAYNTETIGVN